MYAYEMDVKGLKKIMIEKELDSIGSLSDASGVDRNTLGGILSGKIQPSAAAMLKLAGALEMESETAGKIFFAQKLTDCVSLRG